MEIIPNVCRVYELVDSRSLSKAISRKLMEKIFQMIKGLNIQYFNAGIDQINKSNVQQ